MGRFDRYLRRVVPSTAVLSRTKAFRAISRVVDLFLGRLVHGLADRTVPPLRFIVRTGVGNSLTHPYIPFLFGGYEFWLYAFANGWASLGSRIVDIGSGCGKLALPLRDLEHHHKGFFGHYYGYDVDEEMVTWCRKNFPSNRFTFVHVNAKSAVYNPNGEEERVTLALCEDDQVDLVIANSLFSHVLEGDLRNYLSESFRVLRPGGRLVASFFCVEDMQQLGLIGNRWTFRHRVGPCYVESTRYPEAAVGYQKAWITEQAHRVGFSLVQVILPDFQSTLFCVK